MRTAVERFCLLLVLPAGWRRCVQECGHNVQHKVGPRQAEEVCGARKDSELRGGYALKITIHVTPPRSWRNRTACSSLTMSESPPTVIKVGAWIPRISSSDHPFDPVS